MKNTVVYLSLIVAAVFWGANFNVGKLAMNTMSPMSVISKRFLIAGLLMIIILYFKERPTWQMVRQNFWMYALLGFIGIFGMNALSFVGLNHTSAVNASLIMATNPIFTIVLSAIFLREKIQIRQGIGMLVSLVGVVFVLTGGSLNKLGTISGGDILVLGANICWALYGVLGRRYIKNSTSLATSSFTMAAGALFLLPFISTPHVATSGREVTQAWLAIVFMAICCSVLTYIWWNRAIAHIGASRTSIFFNLVPVVTMIIAAFTGESIIMTQLMGAALVIIGVVITTLKSQKTLEDIQTPETM
ncbi:EamA family transporter [Priestia megaterium]|uniref:DMT family transporter n=1 Tax=Priestia megaterium TaxID=1404 RepID=UPI000BFD85E7|nr:EamA family transporter [Priestia megaterium]PGX23287.1 EamA family transporter [Priestia megaterium]